MSRNGQELAIDSPANRRQNPAGDAQGLEHTQTSMCLNGKVAASHRIRKKYLAMAK
jgi:hypothetical protein